MSSVNCQVLLYCFARPLSQKRRGGAGMVSWDDAKNHNVAANVSGLASETHAIPRGNTKRWTENAKNSILKKSRKLSHGQALYVQVCRPDRTCCMLHIDLFLLTTDSCPTIPLCAPLFSWAQSDATYAPWMRN